MTGQALNFMVENSFGRSRPGVAKVGIVFTDGRSQDYIGDAAKKAKDNGEMETAGSTNVTVSSKIKKNKK